MNSNELQGIPTLSPQTYSLIDADNETIKRKFHQPELQLACLPLDENTT